MRAYTKLGVLAVSTIGATAAFLAPASIAQAHNGAIERDCDVVNFSLTKFQENKTGDPAKNNKVQVLRNGVEVKVIEFAGSQTEASVEDTTGEAAIYILKWTKTGPDRHSGSKVAETAPPKGCEEQPSPSTPVEETPTPAPSESVAPTEAPGEGGKALPVTGTSVTLAIGAGAVLLAVGAGAMVMARRRQASS
ncbi:MAG: LPXTG cell wall anchor domain-containing protein [Corynebacteriales bacterium]|nr:LPXTG cell wall anchor domain-containing protein [Mycobacteriales bacterium]